jgi:DNA polymerase-1
VVLFDELKLAPSEGTVRKRTKTGLSTAAGELEKLRKTHPIVKNLLEYRELAKLQSTYIKALPDLVSKRDGRLHTSYNQTIAATGRLSSVNPNLQNIPVGSDGIASEIRKGFIAGKGKTLLAIDYSQIELRIVAHLSGDPTMKKVFQNGEDIHTATAMEINGLKDPKLVTKEMRRDAKTINFGLLYGLSAFGLSERIESLNRAEAAAFIRRYFEAFPKVDAFMAEVAAETHRNGFVQNELGRKRYMPEINSSQHMVRAAAERAAINMPVQSLEADIMKIAMNNIAECFDIRSEEFKMLLQVHDELVFEVRDDRVDYYAKEVHTIMESAYKLSVPLIAEIKIGQNWGEMKELLIDKI